MNDEKVYVVIHRGLTVEGNCKSDEHKFSGEHQGVSLESSGESRE